MTPEEETLHEAEVEAAFVERVVRQQQWDDRTPPSVRGHVTTNQRFAWNEALRWARERDQPLVTALVYATTAYRDDSLGLLASDILDMIRNEAARALEAAGGYEPLEESGYESLPNV